LYDAAVVLVQYKQEWHVTVLRLSLHQVH